MATTLDKETVQRYMNVTQKYGTKETYSAVTDYSNNLRGLKQSLKELESKEKPPVPTEPPITSKDQLIEQALNILGAINPEFKSMAQKVLNDYTIDKNEIQLVKEGPSTGKTEKSADGHMKMIIDATPDQCGVMCVAQELMNASVYQQHISEQKTENQQKTEFVGKTAKMFMGSCIIDYLLMHQPSPPFTPEQIDSLKYQLFNEFSRDIQSLDEDRAIMQAMAENNPEIFDTNLDHYSPEDFLRAMEKFKDQPKSMETIENRIKTIANEGKTPYYLMGSCMHTLAGANLHQKYLKDKDITTDLLIRGIQANATIEQMTGESNKQLLTEQPNALADEVHQTPDSMLNDLRVAEQQQLENDNVPVLEMKKISNN